ncbi:hypothetical protein [Massilia sp. TSP1-1-2]|uniref:hypothetical protein n=1 Tax=Massilia sp. TSP1-1-2 TaxID=2804649 RepID=UPI003CF2763F
MFEYIAFIPLMQHAARLQAELARSQMERAAREREREAFDRAVYGFGAIDVDARFVDDVPQLVFEHPPCRDFSSNHPFTPAELAERMAFRTPVDVMTTSAPCAGHARPLHDTIDVEARVVDDKPGISPRLLTMFDTAIIAPRAAVLATVHADAGLLAEGEA